MLDCRICIQILCLQHGFFGFPLVRSIQYPLYELDDLQVFSAVFLFFRPLIGICRLQLPSCIQESILKNMDLDSVDDMSPCCFMSWSSAWAVFKRPFCPSWSESNRAGQSDVEQDIPVWMPHPCFDRGSQSLAACQSRSLFLFPRCLSSFASLLPANKHAQWVSLAREASTAAMIVYSILSVRELVVRFAFNFLTLFGRYSASYARSGVSNFRIQIAVPRS